MLSQFICGHVLSSHAWGHAGLNSFPQSPGHKLAQNKGCKDPRSEPGSNLQLKKATHFMDLKSVPDKQLLKGVENEVTSMCLQLSHIRAGARWPCPSGLWETVWTLGPGPLGTFLLKGGVTFTAVTSEGRSFKNRVGGAHSRETAFLRKSCLVSISILGSTLFGNLSLKLILKYQK